MSRDNAMGLENGGTGVTVPTTASYIYFDLRAQTGSGAHLFSYSKSAGGSFSADRAVGA